MALPILTVRSKPLPEREDVIRKPRFYRGVFISLAVASFLLFLGVILYWLLVSSLDMARIFRQETNRLGVNIRYQSTSELKINRN